MTTYYVSTPTATPAGSDSNNGTSESTPWATIAKVNAKSPAYQPGDSVLFKRGESWRGQVYVPSTWNGTLGSPITFGAYGEGNKPRILGSLDLWTDDAWSNQGSNIWRHSAGVYDVGNLIFDSEASCGVKKSTSGACTTQGDFYYDTAGDYVDLYSTADPYDAYTAIEASQRLIGVLGAGCDYITLQDLDFRYNWTATQFKRDGSNGVDNIIIERCDARYIGGSYLSGTLRSGNGYEFWGKVSNSVVRYCTAHQVYDAAYSPQNDEATAQSNIIFHHNVASNSAYGIEVFAQNAGTTLDGCVIAHNIFYDNGDCWGVNQRSNPGAGRGFMGQQSQDGSMSNCVFVNNIIHTTIQSIIRVTDPNDWTGWNWDYNCYYPDGASTFWIGTTNEGTGYTFAGWKTQMGLDAHSMVADPSFVTLGSDWHLSSDESPCYDAGVVQANVAQAIVGAAPDIGLYELPLQGFFKLCPFRMP